MAVVNGGGTASLGLPAGKREEEGREQGSFCSASEGNIVRNVVASEKKC